MTTRQSSSERDGRLARARACLEAYGADRARWPEDARALFDKFSDDFRFEISRREAAALDETLAQALAAQAGDAVKERLLAAFEPPRKTGAQKGLFGRARAARLVPVGALAGLSALGFAIGAATANTGIEDDPAFTASSTFSFVSDQGGAFWANDQ